MTFAVHDLMVDVLPEHRADAQEFPVPVHVAEWPEPKPKPKPKPKPQCVPITMGGPPGYLPRTMGELPDLAVLREQLREQLRA